MNKPYHSTSPVGRTAFQRLAILLLAILQIVVTLLPSIGVGDPIGEQSDAARTAITPAGWAFSIWGPLYAGSLAYAVYQLLPAQTDNPLLARIGWPSAGAFLGNAVWALYTQLLSLQAPSALIIAFTLLCLLACYRAFAESPGFSRGEQYLVVLPLSALAAWLTAATIVNISAVLVYHGVDAGDASTTIGAGIVIVGGLIASAAIWTGRGNPWYALVFLWALAGIHAASAGDDPEIAAAALGSALVVALTTLLRLLRRPEDRSHWFQAAGAKASTHSR